MRFVCLGYLDESRWRALSEAERSTLKEDCTAYADELRRGGHFVGGEALQSVRNAVTLRLRDGRVAVSDGPYAQTREQLGGILVLEARDLTHAIQLMSRHPGARGGAFEIRAAEPAPAAVAAGQT